jgi:outer membrane protein
MRVNTMSLQNMRFVVLALFVAVFAAAFPGSARADVKIAVVDFQRIMAESKAGQGLQKQLDAAQKAFQDDMKKQDDALKATQAQLGKEQEAAKSSSEYIQKKADFEKKVAEARQNVQKKKEAIEKAAGVAVNDLRTQATKIIYEIAQKQSYGLVLNRASLILAQDTMDITNAVIKDIDAKVTKIDLKI